MSINMVQTAKPMIQAIITEASWWGRLDSFQILFGKGDRWINLLSFILHVQDLLAIQGNARTRGAQSIPGKRSPNYGINFSMKGIPLSITSVFTMLINLILGSSLMGWTFGVIFFVINVFFKLTTSDGVFNGIFQLPTVFCIMVEVIVIPTVLIRHVMSWVALHFLSER